MLELFAVAVGGSVGAVARYWLTVRLDRLPAHLPYGTLLVNVAGSFLIGLILSYSIHARELDPRLRLLLTTGFLGAFTTFSTLSYETLSLVGRNSYALAGLNLGLNLVLGLTAVWLGTLTSRVF